MELEELVGAIQSLNAEDAFRARLTLDQWRVVAQYLTRHTLRAGDALMRQGDTDRTVYFLGRGSLQAFTAGGPGGAPRISILRAGSVVGEAGLFVHSERSATVEAMTACVVWALAGPRFEEMAQRSPVAALELLRAAGAVMASRLRTHPLPQAMRAA